MTYGILTTMVTGAIAAFIGMYVDIDKLKASSNETDEGITRLEERINDIHWFLITR
jgi:hypothetical protein